MLATSSNGRVHGRVHLPEASTLFQQGIAQEVEAIRGEAGEARMSLDTVPCLHGGEFPIQLGRS